MTRRCLIVVVLLLSCIGLVETAEEGAHAAAEELLILTNVEKTLEQMRGQITQMMQQQLRSIEVPADMTERFEQHMEQMMAMIFEEMSWANTKAEYIDAYASIFTEGELQGLAEFYRTPVGRTFVEKTPELMARMLQISQTHSANLIPKITQMTQDLIASAATQDTDE